MKKVLTALAAITLIFVLAGCNKTEPQKPVEPEPEPVKILTKKSARFLYQDASLYNENDEGKMIWVAEADLAEAVQVYYDNDKPETKTAIRLLSNGKEEEFEFVKVCLDDEDFWTRDIFLSPLNAGSAVVISVEKDAFIYSQPDVLYLTKDTLPFGTVVLTGDAKDDFTEVFIYNGVANGKTVYLKASDLSTNAADVIAIQTMNRINDKTDEVVLDELMYLIDSLNLSVQVEDYYYMTIVNGGEE